MKRISIYVKTNKTDLFDAYHEPSKYLSENHPTRWMEMVNELEKLIKGNIIVFRYHYVENGNIVMNFYSRDEQIVSKMAIVVDTIKLYRNFNSVKVKCMSEDEYQSDINGKECVSIGSAIYENTKLRLQ